MQRTLAEHWEIGEDPYGIPAIIHRHTALPVPAHVIGRAEDQVTAECSQCGEILDLPASVLELAR
jgi:hypothetical protein